MPLALLLQNSILLGDSTIASYLGQIELSNLSWTLKSRALSGTSPTVDLFNVSYNINASVSSAFLACSSLQDIGTIIITEINTTNSKSFFSRYTLGHCRINTIDMSLAIPDNTQIQLSLSYSTMKVERTVTAPNGQQTVISSDTISF